MSPSMLRRPAAALAMLIAAAGPAAAQTAGSDRAGVATDLDGKRGTLSDKLGRTDGVVRPPGDVDPAMRKPTPAGEPTPVVKPGDLAPGTAK